MATMARHQAWKMAIPSLLLSLGLAGCGGDSDNGSDGPVSGEAPVVHATGNNANGQQVFRFETFGNERFWTDALRLQQGMVAAGVTPLRALQLGLVIDSDAIDAVTLAAIRAELLTNLSPANAPLLNDPATTVKLVNANAVVGIAAKDSNGTASSTSPRATRPARPARSATRSAMAPFTAWPAVARSASASTAAPTSTSTSAASSPPGSTRVPTTRRCS
jgi:hypothetical protein